MAAAAMEVKDVQSPLLLLLILVSSLGLLFAHPVSKIKYMSNGELALQQFVKCRLKDVA